LWNSGGLAPSSETRRRQTPDASTDGEPGLTEGVSGFGGRPRDLGLHRRDRRLLLPEDFEQPRLERRELRVFLLPEVAQRFDRQRLEAAQREALILTWTTRAIFVRTTVHLPDRVLRSLDRRARALGIRRNRLIVRGLEREVGERTRWAPEFLERLRDVDAETSAAVDDFLAVVKRPRRSKGLLARRSV
jgi:hypothetical protein